MEYGSFVLRPEKQFRRKIIPEHWGRQSDANNQKTNSIGVERVLEHNSLGSMVRSANHEREHRSMGGVRVPLHVEWRAAERLARSNKNKTTY